MSKFKKLSHVIYHHRYHTVWTPKYRFRVLQGAVKEAVEQKIRMICEWKKLEIIELNIQADHVHIILDVPPKLSISQVMGYLKGKTAIQVFKKFPGLKKKPYWGIIFGQEAIVQVQLVLMKKRLGNTSSIKRNKND